MENNELRPVQREASLFAASGFYLLAAFGLCLTRAGAEWIGRMLTMIWPTVTPEWANLLVSFWYYGLFMLLPLLYWAASKPGRFAAMRLNPVSTGTMIRIVLIALMASVGINSITMVWSALWQRLGFDVFVTGASVPANTAELTRSILSASVIATVSEEMLFRGLLFPAWEMHGTRRAVWISSLLFAAIHGSVVGFPGQLLCGLIVTLLVFFSDSIYAGMIFHGAYNAILLMLSFIAERAEGAAESAAQMQADIVAAVGGGPGLVMTLIEGAVLFLWIAGLMRGVKLQSHSEPLPAQKKPLSAGTLLLILAGVMTTLLFYGLDFVTMWGGMA